MILGGIIMGELVCCGIAPHGFSIIGEIAGEELEMFQATREAMETLGKTIIKHKPDTIIILTPHGLRLKGYNAIYTTECSRGTLKGNGKTLELEFTCDREMAQVILKKAQEENIPAVGCNFGALSKEASNIEMDWGAFIPLWFCTRKDYHPEVIIIGPTRDIPLTKLVQLGEIIAKVCKESNRKAALIASADQGHCHDPKGPYGFNEASKDYDEKIISIIKDNKLHKLLDMDMDFVEKAKPDSLWQMLILYGALKVTPMVGKLISYEVPTYFGMAVASYEPKL
jgi:aromatic ring-opening dioxygenase LigB subunit